MARWLRLTLILLLIHMLGVSLVRTLVHSVPTTLEKLFTSPDGMPCPQSCLFGVIPGVTTVTEAVRLLHDHPVTRAFHLVSEEPFRLEAHGDRILMVTFNPSPDGLVDEITLTSFVRYGSIVGETLDPLPPTSTLAEAISVVGNPDFLLLTTGGDPLLVYTDEHIALSLLRGTMKNRHMVPRTQISRLTVFRYSSCPPDAFEYVFQDWQGMTSLRGYIRATTLYLMVRRMASAGPSFAPCQMPRP
ncbi:MAG: hypothetical protein KF726_08250 [Anaerolineae bacterium]|nr:hypothetical protein [Anaerolineae bacterium]